MVLQTFCEITNLDGLAKSHAPTPEFRGQQGFMQSQIVTAGSSQPRLKLGYGLNHCNNQGADVRKSCFVANWQVSVHAHQPVNGCSLRSAKSQ